MTDVTTPTDSAEEEAQATEQPNPTETQATQSEETSEATSTEEETVDQETLDWAAKKGLSLDDPVKLAKMVREGEKKMHQATSKASELRDAVQEHATTDEPNEVFDLVQRLKVTDFFLNNPEAKELDSEMAKIITEKPYLAQDLDAVYDLAKFKSANSKLDEERKAGRQEALQQVAQAENASAPQTSATTRQTPGEITDADVEKMTLEQYKAYRAEKGGNPWE